MTNNPDMTNNPNTALEWARLWIPAVIIGVALAIGGPISCNIYEDHLVANAIKDGTDPIAASCARYGMANNGSAKVAICASLAIKRQQ